MTKSLKKRYDHITFVIEEDENGYFVNVSSSADSKTRESEIINVVVNACGKYLLSKDNKDVGET